MIRVKKTVEVYETIDTFVEEVSRKASPNVKLENIKNLFCYFFGSLMFILFLAIMNIVLFKQLKRIIRKLLRFSAIVAQVINFGPAFSQVATLNLKSINLE